MGRKSKLTEAQWADIEKRMLAGKESMRSIAREYGISANSIGARLSSQNKSIKNVANQIVKTELMRRELPISSQIKANNLANDLLAMSEHLAAGANAGAAVYHRLNKIAQQHMEKVDDADPLEPKSAQALQTIAILVKTAKLSAEGALELGRINRDQMEKINEQEAQKARSEEKRVRTSDPVEASRTYQSIMGGT